MKIAVWHNLPSGGGKRALHYHVRGLIQRGHHVESWCPSSADQSYLPLSEFITEHILPFPRPPRPSKHQRLSRVLATYDDVDKMIAIDRHCQKCAIEITQNDFDLLFANTCMYTHVSSIARYVKIPKVLYLQEPYRGLYEARPRLPWVALPTPKGFWHSPKYIKNFLLDLIGVQRLRIVAREELRNANTFDAVLVNSFFSRESILRAYGLDAKVCYLGIDTGLFINQHRQREDFIVGLGAFVAPKNIRFVIEALSNVQEPRPRLVWVGNSDDPVYLEEQRQFAQAVSVDFEPKVRVTDAELVDIMNRAALMVYMPRLEPFGFAPLEANACGLPVIAVAEGGLRETVVDGLNGLLVEYDVKAVARAIDRLRSEKDYARKLGESGHKLVGEKWSLEPSIDRLESRFAEVIDKGLF